MNRRFAVISAVIPLIGLTLQGGASLRAEHEHYHHVQRTHRQSRRAMVSSARKAAEGAVVVALHKNGTTVGEPSFSGGVSISEGPLPKNAFLLPTGDWWPRDTFAVRDETWSVQGTYSVREKADPTKITERQWETVMHHGLPPFPPTDSREISEREWKAVLRWDTAHRRWQIVSVDLNYDWFGSSEI